jgi:hypothetical protein
VTIQATVSTIETSSQSTIGMLNLLLYNKYNIEVLWSGFFNVK